jgi:hypothetical protein
MASHPPHALRLTFAYRGAQINLIASERVAMVVPAPATAPPTGGETGYWFGVRDAAGRIVYHRPLVSPLRTDVETFSPDRPIARMPIATREGRFTVLIPDQADARTFELHGPADPQRPDEPAQQLLRFDVDALRKWQPPRTGRTTP